MVLSSFGDSQTFLAAFRQQGFILSVLAERRFVNEKLAIFKLTAAGSQFPP
jgi:hypothetical protein